MKFIKKEKFHDMGLTIVCVKFNNRKLMTSLFLFFMRIVQCCVDNTLRYGYRYRLYYDSSIRGYSALIYNNKKYALIKLHKNGNIYMYYK